MAIKGIDVSSHQGTIDWRKVRADDVEFAWVKANEGDWRDKTAARNGEHARANYIRVGAYNFIRPKPGRTGAQEFDLFYGYAKPSGLLQPGCLRPVIDVEATKLGPADTRAYVGSWIGRCFRVLGKHPIVYTGKWFWEDIMHGDARRYGCKLWLAAYVKPSERTKHVPDAWKGHASFWQYTDKGQVAGIRGNVDMNLYLSTKRNLIRSHTIGGA